MDISNSVIDMYQLDIEELTSFIEMSKRQNIKRQFEEHRRYLIQMMEEEKKNLEKKTQNEANGASQETSTEASNTASSMPNNMIDPKLTFVPISKYALDTSNSKFVKVYLTEGLENLKTINPKNILSKFTAKTFDVCILDWNKKNFRFSCRNLNKEIAPEGSYVKPTSSGSIIYLQKAKSGDYWDALEKKKSVIGKGDSEEKDEEKDEEDPTKAKDPNASLMDMMKDMYQNGDPEMKKIIAEAWTKSQESGGKDMKI